jgi:hypothetical protein
MSKEWNREYLNNPVVVLVYQVSTFELERSRVNEDEIRNFIFRRVFDEFLTKNGQKPYSVISIKWYDYRDNDLIKNCSQEERDHLIQLMYEQKIELVIKIELT